MSEIARWNSELKSISTGLDGWFMTRSFMALMLLNTIWSGIQSGLFAFSGPLV
jgi:hypothetical protein